MIDARTPIGTRREGNRYKSLKYGEIGVMVDAEADRLDMEHKCWMTLDLGDGDVVTCVWFGTAAKMNKLRRQLETVPEINLALVSRDADSDKIHAALRTKDKQKRKPTSKRPLVQKTRDRLRRVAR